MILKLGWTVALLLMPPLPTSDVPPGHVAVTAFVVAATDGPGVVLTTTWVCAGPPLAQSANPVTVSPVSPTAAKPPSAVHVVGSSAPFPTGAPVTLLGTVPFTLRPFVGRLESAVRTSRMPPPTSVVPDPHVAGRGVCDE